MKSFTSSEWFKPACAVAAILLLLLIEFVCGVFGAAGATGFGITLFLAPIVFFARTPKSWAFLTIAAVLLAFIPVAITANQLLQPLTGREYSWERQRWEAMTPPSVGDVAGFCIPAGILVLLCCLGAFAIWKRQVFASKVASPDRTE